MDLRMTWLGAAGWLLRWQEQVIVLDPFFHRPPAARPTLPIGRDELPPIDHLVATHGHWDHFADVPHLAVTRARRTWVPAAALADLRRAWRRAEPGQRRHGPDAWSAIQDGASTPVGALEMSFHRIGTERFDLAMARSSIAKLRRSARLEDWVASGRFLMSHLFGACHAVVLALPEPGRSIAFFGNLSPDVGRLGERHPALDVCVLPYCPANGDWLEESVAVARALRPRMVLVHHFDQFLPPVTVGLDLAGYAREVQARAGIERVVIPKFYSETSLEALLDEGAGEGRAWPGATRARPRAAPAASS